MELKGFYLLRRKMAAKLRRQQNGAVNAGSQSLQIPTANSWRYYLMIQSAAARGSMMNRSVYFLKSFEDVVGNLSEVVEIDGHKTATIGGVCVGIPEEIATKLLPYIGKRIGLLKADTDFRIKSDGVYA
jgi:hypothetical protein